jgi:polysaccharide export outer membrane protein
MATQKMMLLRTKKQILLLALGTVPLWGQISRPVVDTPIAAPATTTMPDHKVVPNDLLSVTVFDEPELTRPAIRVGEDGTIVMPELTNRQKVEGLLPREIEAKIKQAYMDDQILVSPIVSVSIMEYAAKQISVVGDVKIPGQFNITQPITLYEALAKAGWTTADAGEDVLFSKTPSEAPRTINLDDLQKSTDSSLNVTLTGGELVNVPDAPKVWVTGNVSHPQAVPVRRPGDATVLKVLASVQGLTPYYGKMAYIYRADTPNGPRHEVPVPLKDIMHRKAQDMPMMTDDILLIPDDNGNLRRAWLSELQSVSGGAANALVYTGITRAK